jgi:3-hydroxyisobutyrate dehydrogenase
MTVNEYERRRKMQYQNIGWIGTGVMGKSMCSHLLKKGYNMCVFNRTRAKAEELLEQGAGWCDNPREVAEKSDVIFSIVGYPEDVEAVIFAEDGVLSGVREGSVIVDMTTSKPSLAKEIAEGAAEKGATALDAPVSGGDVGAREGKLAIMIGGEKKTYEQILPLFELMGENIAYMGEAGAGQHTKMSNQIHIATTMIGVVEALLYGYRAGLDLDAVIDVIGKGAASSWSLNNLGRRMVKGNFEPGFYVKHFVKDMGIALEEARRMRLALPGLAMAYQFYVAAMAEGLEDKGTHVLYKVFDRMSSG